ncbi:MAG: reverse transcriptase family protein, partial [Candidatus Thiodiazotropha sp.]
MLMYLSQFDIFSLSETWVLNRELVENILPSHTCYFCAAIKTKSLGRAMAGLTVYVRTSLSQHVKRIKSQCDFAIFLQLDKIIAKTDKDIVFCFPYIPPETSTYYDNKQLKGISLLENEILDIDINNVYLIIAGDLNARTAELPDFFQCKNNVPDLDEYDEILNTCDGVRNRSSCDKTVNKFGKQLINFCIAYSLLIINGRNGDDEGIGNFTFTGAMGNSVIDYIICSQSLFKYFKSFKIEERTESAHFPLSIKFDNVDFNIHVHTYNEDHDGYIRTKYVFNDENILEFREALNSKLTNTFVSELSGNINSIDTDVNDILKVLIEVLKSCATSCKKTFRSRNYEQPKWFDDDCKYLKAEKYRLLKRYRRSQSLIDLEQYKHMRNVFKSLCDKKERQYQSKQLEDLVEASNNPKSFWKKVKCLKNVKRSPSANISNDEWKRHFEQLFSLDEIPNDSLVDESLDDDLNINLDEIQDSIFNSNITEEEVIKSVHALHESKAAGLDEISPGFFIHSIDIILPLVVRFFNRLFESGEFPESWGRSCIIPIPKKGDMSCAENYRGISLLDIFGKLYTCIINRRLNFYVNLYSKISEAQAGFREGYSTVDNLFILQSLISKYLSKQRGKLYVGYVDFKAAFDSVQRNKLWPALQRAGLHGKLFKAIQSVYKCVKSCVRANYSLTNFFDCPVGLRQGCMLSPILFSLFINEFVELIEQSGLRGVQLYPEIVEIFLLLFADDVALISDSVIGLQRQFYLLQDFCREQKLNVNIPKTKVVVYKNGSLLARNERWTFNGINVEVVNCFTYLGLSLSMQLSYNRMAEDLALKGKRVLISLLNSLYTLGQMPKNVFFTLFDRKIVPVLLYGSEIWGFSKRESTELVHRYACKRYMCVSLHSSNAAVLGDCGRFPLWIEAAKRCIKYWLRILCMDDSRYVRKCY